MPHTKLHRPDEQLRDAAFVVEHGAAQAPQALASVWVLTSQPFATLASQSAKSASQLMLQFPAAQVGVPFCDGHTAGQAPQCSGSVLRSTSQPFSALPSQLPKPEPQLIWQASTAQLAVPPADEQTTSQPLQLLGSVRVLTSQPSSLAPGWGPLQSARPALHV